METKYHRKKRKKEELQKKSNVASKTLKFAEIQGCQN